MAHLPPVPKIVKKNKVNKFIIWRGANNVKKCFICFIVNRVHLFYAEGAIFNHIHIVSEKWEFSVWKIFFHSLSPESDSVFPSPPLRYWSICFRSDTSEAFERDWNKFESHGSEYGTMLSKLPISEIRLVKAVRHHNYVLYQMKVAIISVWVQRYITLLFPCFCFLKCVSLMKN